MCDRANGDAHLNAMLPLMPPSTDLPQLPRPHVALHPRARFSESPDVLAQVGPPQRHGGGPDLAVWQRSAPSDFQAWMDALPEDALPSLHRVADAQGLEHDLQQGLDALGMSNGEMRNLLLADLMQLVRRFVRLNGCEQLSLRLGDLRSEVDRQWLCMGAPLRMVCSYRGPASECRLGARASLDTAWLAQERCPASLLAPMDVVVFNARGRMLHRRPRFLVTDGRPRPWALSLVAAPFDDLA